MKAENLSLSSINKTRWDRIPPKWAKQKARTSPTVPAARLSVKPQLPRQGPVATPARLLVSNGTRLKSLWSFLIFVIPKEQDVAQLGHSDF